MNETTKVTLRIPLDLKRRLTEFMWVRRANLTQVLIEALREYCERHALPDPGEEAPKLPEQSVKLQEESRLRADSMLPWDDI